MFRKFASLADPAKYGYTFESGAFDSRAQVSAHFRMFETYGDKLTQHSHDWAVTPEFIGDYLASLAVAMGPALPDQQFEGSCPTCGQKYHSDQDSELIEAAFYQLSCGPSERDIAFAATVKYKDDGKLRYYSVKERKVSSSPSKVHDKRYEEITSQCDGSARSIYCRLIPEWADGMRRYCHAHAIRTWALQQDDGPWMEMPALFLEWTKDRDVAREIDNAYSACWFLVQAHQNRHSANTAIENYKRMLANRGVITQNT